MVAPVISSAPDASPPRLFALVPCAGVGTRSGASMPKQYCRIAGRELLHYTLSAFDRCGELTQTLLVLAPDDSYFAADRYAGLHFTVQRCGGETRQATVLNGILALLKSGAAEHDWVLVHDAARPGITPDLIRALIAAVRDPAGLAPTPASANPVAELQPSPGGILALPLADTLKRQVAAPAGAADGPIEEGASKPLPRIARTEARDGLWQAQTPQMFRLGALRDGLLRAHAEHHAVTDEASVMEWLGVQPRLVQGSQRNFKVTYPEDFELAQAVLAAPSDRNV